MSAAAVELDELTRIGFGCYRVDVRVAQHREALTRALSAGCNLVDTASNYTDGYSEMLVGEVLDATQARAFVVTKVGYVSPSAAVRLEREGIPVGDLPRLESGTPYSIDPSVLRTLIDQSRERLRRRRLDAVLLHNPEKLGDAGATDSEIRNALRDAFAFLEEEVTAGRVRHYGVSSNALPTADLNDPLDLETLTELSDHGFALIQFPLNLFERAAATDNGERPSLIGRSTSVKTLINRPLNAIVDGRQVRLADVVPYSGSDPWDECVALVSEQLVVLGRHEPWASFRPMQFLRDNRHDIPDPDLVDVIWEAQIDPFVDALFGADPMSAARSAFSRLRVHAKFDAQTRLADGSKAMLSALSDAGLLNAESTGPLAVTACRYCLASGADHVLVGMRRREYVDELAPLFGV